MASPPNPTETMTIYAATQTKAGWIIQHPTEPIKEVHQSLPVAISEMKRRMGEAEILIKF
jgi:hypothetical protein